MVGSCSLYRHEDEMLGFSLLGSPNQVGVAPPVDGLRAGRGGPSKPLDRRDDDPGPCRRPFDGTCVLYVARDDLHEVATQVLGPPRRIPRQDPHLEPPRRQQTYDLGSQRPRPAGYQDHLSPLMRGRCEMGAHAVLPPRQALPDAFVGTAIALL